MYLSHLQISGGVLGCEEVPLSLAKANVNPPMDVDVQRMYQISQGDEGALKELISKWKNPVFAYFQRSLGNLADSEELTQKVFFRVFSASGKYHPSAKFSTWLFTIARNLLIDEIKKRSRRSCEVELLDDSSSASEEAEVREIHEELQREMVALPENQRTALLLRVQGEWSYAEIASLMEASESSVKTWIYRARQYLRESIKW